MVASANAYIVALNKLIEKRKRKNSGIGISVQLIISMRENVK